MAYKKPQIVAKSAAKQSFVAGCPEQTLYADNYADVCGRYSLKCMIASTK